jgi:hypothetical protein
MWAIGIVYSHYFTQWLSILQRMRSIKIQKRKTGYLNIWRCNALCNKNVDIKFTAHHAFLE